MRDANATHSAHALLNTVYADYAIRYADDNEPPPPSQPKQPAPTSHFEFDNWDRTLLGQSDNNTSVVDAYLSEPVIYCKDPIAHWRGEIIAKRRVPLAHMALDYLSIPCASSLVLINLTLRSLFVTVGTSVDVERAFSRGRRAISLYRHRMSEGTARSTIAFGSWAAEDIVQRDKLVDAIENLSSRRPRSATSDFGLAPTPPGGVHPPSDDGSLDYLDD